MPAPRPRRLSLLIAVPVAGALAVSGAYAVVGTPSPQEGTIALAGSSIRSQVSDGADSDSAADPTTTTTSKTTAGQAPEGDTAVRAHRPKRQPSTWRSRPRWSRTTAAPTTETADKAVTSTPTSENGESSDSESSTAPSSSSTTASSFAAEVATLTNEQRVKAGCSALTENATLTKVAQAHSQDMATNNYFSHTNPQEKDPFERMAEAGYQFRAAAENIAAGYPSPEAVVAGWMNSPGHKANIVNCNLTEIGVGYATGSGTFSSYWTQDFGTPR